MQAFPARVFLNPPFSCQWRTLGTSQDFLVFSECNYLVSLFFFETLTQFTNTSYLTMKFNKRLEKSSSFIPALSLTGRGCTCHIHSVLRHLTVPIRKTEKLSMGFHELDGAGMQRR